MRYRLGPPLCRAVFSRLGQLWKREDTAEGFLVLQTVAVVALTLLQEVEAAERCEVWQAPNQRPKIGRPAHAEILQKGDLAVQKGGKGTQVERSPPGGRELESTQRGGEQ